MVIKVVLVEDQTLVREGIRSLLRLTDEIVVVGEAGDGDDGLRVIAETTPDVVLLDLRMPRRDGLATLRAMVRPRPAVLVLTTFDDDDAVLLALQAGAEGYLLKDVTLEHLVASIRTVAAGGTVVQPGITAGLLQRIGGVPPEDARLDRVDPLTSREVEILRLVVGGYANREIAAALYLSEGTVKNYVSRILEKLGVRDRTRAALRGLELGIVQRPA
jgi:DNA-binding NarL/FixJ family response regulator